ncbi:hypothetical protein DQ04_14831030, partial [Trypanosoma grayi]|uniref:hypothetical protein n=1 Tax=Trypanosoma grayi TaxID=71804 RepID=UPI0004F4A08F
RPIKVYHFKQTLRKATQKVHLPASNSLKEDSANLGFCFESAFKLQFLPTSTAGEILIHSKHFTKNQAPKPISSISRYWQIKAETHATICTLVQTNTQSNGNDSNKIRLTSRVPSQKTLLENGRPKGNVTRRLARPR